ARRLLRLGDDDVGLERPHRRPHAEHALDPGAPDVLAHGHASRGGGAQPRRPRPPEQRADVAACAETARGLDHPALDASVGGAAVRVDEEDPHSAWLLTRGTW